MYKMSVLDIVVVTYVIDMYKMSVLDIVVVTYGIDMYKMSVLDIVVVSKRFAVCRASIRRGQRKVWLHGW